MSKIYIDQNKKMLINGRRKYHLEYGFCCPLTNEPVFAILKVKDSDIDPMLMNFFCGKHTYRGYAGFVFREVNKGFEVYNNAGETEYSLTYFYGLNQDKLIENSHESMGLKTSLKNFKKKLLDGNAKNAFIETEIVKGKDLMIVFKNNV